MKIYLTIFIFFLSAAGSISIAESHSDSTKYIVTSLLKNTQKPDTLIINKLNELAAYYFKFNADSSLYYAKLSILFAQKINYKKGLAYGLLNAGHVFYNSNGDFRAAKKNFDKAILIFGQLNDKKGLGKGFLIYGKMYKVLADYKTSLNYLNRAVEVNEQIKNEADIADDYKNMGTVYYSADKLSIALNFYYKALYIEIKLHNNQGIAANYNNIGIVLNSMGLYPKALDYFNKALQAFSLANDLQGIGAANENIGEALMLQNKNVQATGYFLKAVKILKKLGDKFETTAVYIDLGLCYANNNQFSLAITYLTNALEMAKKYNITYNQALALVNFAKVYNLKGDYKSAYVYAIAAQKSADKLRDISVRAKALLELNKTLSGLKAYNAAYKVLTQYNSLRDTLNENIQKLALYNLEQDFMTQKKQLELQQQEKDNIYKQRIQYQLFIIGFFLILVFVMIGMSLIYYRQKHEQQKINVALEEKNQEVSRQKYDLDEQAQRLNNSNTLKERLIFILAHDLRAPLSTLRGLFNLLQDKSISYTEMLRMIPEVLKKLEYTSDFLDTLLFWINSQMENFENTVKDFKIKDLIALETSVYKEQAALKGINLIDCLPEGLIANADPNSIRIVVRNLITNAIKFSNENDKIEVNASAYDEKNLIITVSDTGTGMSNEQAYKLFKTKVTSKTGTGNETGTGMGLLFCKDLVEKCNGKIWVSSKQGEGTTFSFTVPAGVSS